MGTRRSKSSERRPCLQGLLSRARRFQLAEDTVNYELDRASVGEDPHSKAPNPPGFLRRLVVIGASFDWLRHLGWALVSESATSPGVKLYQGLHLQHTSRT